MISYTAKYTKIQTGYTYAGEILEFVRSQMA